MAGNLFFFTGEETYLLHEQVMTWKKAFAQKHSDMNLLTLDGSSVPVGEMIADITALPFLSDKRLIFIEGLPEAASARKTGDVSDKDKKRDEQLTKLLEALPGVPETSVVVFVQPNPDKRRSFYKKLSKLVQIKEFKPLQGGALNAWVKNEFQKWNGQIDSHGINTLISLTGPNLWRLSQEIQKLVTYSEGRLITVQAIEELVVPNMEANIFHLTDALGARNPQKAIQNLHRSMAAGEDLHQVFYMVARQFRLFLQVGSYANKMPNATSASIASALKLHPFVAKNTLEQVRRFDMPQLKKAHAKLLDIDLKLKTSKIRTTKDDQEELAMAIEKFMIEFCSA